METITNPASIGAPILILILFFYFLPSIFALIRRTNRIGGILALNLLLGWTFLGWGVAVVWAFGGDRRKRQS